MCLRFQQGEGRARERLLPACRRGTAAAQQISTFALSKADVIGELFVRCGVVLSLLLDLDEDFEAFLEKILLLQASSEDVEWLVLRIGYPFGKASPFGNLVLAFVHNDLATCCVRGERVWARRMAWS